MERAERENARKARTFWGLGDRKQGLSSLPSSPRFAPQVQLCQSRACVSLYDCSKPMNPRAGDRETKLPLTMVTRTAT